MFSSAMHSMSAQEAYACQKCHGQVETMDRIRLNQELTMGWCINCHRSTNLKFNENLFYSQYKELTERVKSGEI